MFSVRLRYIAFGLLWAGSVSVAQEVTFSVPDDLRSALRSASLTANIKDEENPTAQDYVAAARADYRRLLTALYAKGYYGPSISILVNGIEASNIAPLDAPNTVRSVSIDVDSGPLFRFGQAEIAPLPPRIDTEIALEGFATGERALSDVVRTSVANTITSWRDAGYAKAEVAGQSLRANHADSKLDVSVTLDTGPQLTFGPMTVQGNRLVRTAAITRIAGLPEGAVFSPETLETVVRRLRKTGAFDSVAIAEADQIGQDDTLATTLTVAESKLRRLGFGIEVSTIDGLTLSTFWLHRNSFGGAERFRIDGEISGIGDETGGVDYSVATSLTVPAIYGAERDLRASFAISREDEPTYLIDKISTELKVTRTFASNVVSNYGFGLLRAREETEDETREYTLLTIPLGLEWDNRDDPTNPKDGAYADLDVTPFFGLSGVDNGAQVYLDARGYKSFGEQENLTLALRAQVGSLIGASPENAPADFLFYSGGGGTVRGQGYKTLGVEGSDGDTRGGASFAGLQMETRYGVTDTIGVVGFYDVGYVGDSEVPLEDGDWHAGTGVGVRYNTGIGPIRLDVGTPANGSDAFGSIDVYIGIGQAF